MAHSYILKQQLHWLTQRACNNSKYGSLASHATIKALVHSSGV
jgi:hypothetical protein